MALKPKILQNTKYAFRVSKSTHTEGMTSYKCYSCFCFLGKGKIKDEVDFKCHMLALSKDQGTVCKEESYWYKTE